MELLLEQRRTVARSIVSTRISIKVPASRSYTRIPLVKSVGLRTCAHASARVLTHTSPPTNSFRIFLDTQYDMRLGWKMRKRMIFRLCAIMFDTEMRLRKLCDKHIHYKQCLRFLSNKYNVLTVIFVMCINDRCHHSQYSLQPHNLLRNSFTTSHNLSSTHCLLRIYRDFSLKIYSHVHRRVIRTEFNGQVKSS